MSNRWASSGVCEVGVAKKKLNLREKLGMAGYSWIGKFGKNGPDTLYARALSIRDRHHTTAVICIVDLVCPSLALTARVTNEVKKRTNPPLNSEQIMLLGTHTHTAPGYHQHNSFFRLFQQPLKFSYLFYQPKWVKELAKPISAAIVEAVKDMQPGWLGIDQAYIWRKSSNRSLRAFQNEPEGQNWNQPGKPGNPLPSGYIKPEQMAVDPRLITIVARAGGEPRAAFGWFGCHSTALGPKQRKYNRDWPGFAVELLDTRYPDFCAAVGLSASGDVSPLPPAGLKNPDSYQGRQLAEDLGRLVASKMAASIDASSVQPSDDLKVEICAGSWSPTTEPQKFEWKIGWPSLGGAEDGQSDLHRVFPEGQRDTGTYDPTDTQYPKLSALGTIQDILRGIGLNVAPWHPWQRFVFGNHAFVSVPGEATTLAAYKLEQRVRTLSGVTNATVVGYGGDYAGYFTTECEYIMQHYEGAMTLYGRLSLASLAAAVSGTCQQYLPFPDYPEAVVADRHTQKVFLNLFSSPVLLAVPVGPNATKQVFVLWIGKEKTKAKHIFLKEGEKTYAAVKISTASKMFKELIKILALKKGDTLLIAQFIGVSPQRINEDSLLKYKKKRTLKWEKKCIDLR